MKILRAQIALILCVILSAVCLPGCAKTEPTLDPKKPTAVTIWHYYNGDQLTAFDALVKQFNTTVGAEQGIVVTAVSQGNIDNLASCLLDTVNGKVGAADMPSAAAVYAETVYILNQKNTVVSLNDYFSDAELSQYVPGFLEEGKLTEGGDLFLLPVSKSTESFMINLTDWQPFADATGILPESIQTYEDLTAAAKAYYEWTDSLTPAIENDGKALYGRDSVANYIFVGAKQLGHELFTVDAAGNVTTDLDKATFRALWDNYYIPFVQGYFSGKSNHRSDDMKDGTVLALTVSTSGATYIPTAVTDANDESHTIEVSMQSSLHFANGEPISVQQGAGYCIMKTTEAEQFATAEFFKWLTDTEQNLKFSVSSGYSPVKLEANNADRIRNVFEVTSPKTQNVLNALLVSAEIYTGSTTYASRAFNGSKEVRDVLANALKDAADNDRAVIVEKIAAGVSAQEAIAPYLTDAYFNAWFEALCAQVTDTVKS